MTASPAPPRWNRDAKRLVTVIALLAALALVYMARNIISLVALASVIAYIFQPVIGWFERRGDSRGMAALLCVFILILLVALGPVLLTPYLVKSIESIIGVLNRLPGSFQEWTTTIVEKKPVLNFLGQQLNLAEWVQGIDQSMSQAVSNFKLPGVDELITYLMTGMRTAGGLVQTAVGIAAKVVTVAFNILLLLVLVFFLTKDSNQIGPWIKNLIEPRFLPEMADLGRHLDQVWKSFFRGQLLLALVIGVVVTVVTWALGLEGALVLGILAGVMEVIPNLGPVLAMIPAVLVALIQGPGWLDVSNLTFALIITGAYFLIQQLENNILVPRIMGRSLNLHPLLVLLGVVVGASFAGVLGAFLAAPVLASLKVLGLYAHAKITDRNPAEIWLRVEHEGQPEKKKPGRVATALGKQWNKIKSRLQNAIH